MIRLSSMDSTNRKKVTFHLEESQKKFKDLGERYGSGNSRKTSGSKNDSLIKCTKVNNHKKVKSNNLSPARIPRPPRHQMNI